MYHTKRDLSVNQHGREGGGTPLNFSYGCLVHNRKNDSMESDDVKTKGVKWPVFYKQEKMSQSDLY